MNASFFEHKNIKMGNILLPLRFLLISFLLPSICFSQVTEQWVNRYNAEFKGMTVDASGNVYVIARSWSIAENITDYVTVKYDSEGKLLWTKRYNDPYNANDDPTAIAVDHFGNVYVTGAAYNKGVGSDYTTLSTMRRGMNFGCGIMVVLLIVVIFLWPLL
jgi:hypothetical protein